MSGTDMLVAVSIDTSRPYDFQMAPALGVQPFASLQIDGFLSNPSYIALMTVAIAVTRPWRGPCGCFATGLYTLMTVTVD
jgi:hypothetical protein